MKNWIKTMLFVSALCLAACSDDPDVAPLKRDTDAVELTYNSGATTQISVRYAGSWSARVECTDGSGAPVNNWFSVSPDNGVGNGRDYQWVTVTAERNPGDKRTGYIYLKPANGEEIKIEVAQADGHFSVNDPVISGTLKSNTESAAMLEIAYDKAFGEEMVEIEATLDGLAAEGLGISSPYQSVIEHEGSGTISVPITGVPVTLGEVVCHVTFKLDGVVKFQGDVSGNVSSSNEVFGMGFDLFKWGGDYPNNKKGPGPNGKDGAGKEFDGTEPAEPDVISAGSDGTSDVFNTMGETYRINRGVEKWSGLRVYEHPGYVKLGVTANGGWIMTPELESLSAAPETVSVSIDFLRFDNETGTYIVSAEGAGVVTNGEVNNTVLPAQTSAAGRKWKTLTFTVQDATNKTRIKIEAQTYNEKGYRINIDNIVVMAADKTEVTEKLPAPELEKITYTPAKTSVAFAWEGVKDNDSYFSAYLPEWDRADWMANSSNIGLAAGYMKFGGGKKPAWLTLPKLSSLSGATEIELEFDACPYYEPSTKGDMMAPSNTDIMEYFGVTVTGATIVSVTGETSADAVISDGGATVTLRNVLVDKMIEEGLKDTYRYTNHKVKITGVTADTRIKIYSALVGKEGENYRMWLDNLKVKKVN